MVRIFTTAAFAALMVIGASTVNAALSANGVALNGASSSPVTLTDVQLP